MLEPHPKQAAIIRSDARFKVIRAGRKGGKTLLEVENIVFKAVASVSRLKLLKTEFATGRKVVYIAPTQDQARTIVWEALKRRLDGIGVSNEQRMQIRVPNEDGEESTIFVGGWENRENYRGFTDVVHITFDEVDTLRDFFIAWKEIFRPMFLDTGGTADFVGTPKKENPNLRRLEKEAEMRGNHESFHFTSKDNPYLSPGELKELEDEYANDRTTYLQEVMAEYVDNTGALFHYDALVDVFSNTVDKNGQKYMLVDVADDGSDRTIISLWENLEEYHREEYARFNTENIIDKIRELAKEHRIPFSHIAVDAIGVGAGVASSSMLDGIIGYKSSYSAIATDQNIIRLPNVGQLSTPFAPRTTDFRNLRSQCVFTLASLINDHKVASKVSGKQQEHIIEELSAYQDESAGDGKRQATPKEKVAAFVGRSPDASDTWLMRCYFVLREKMLPMQSAEATRIHDEQRRRMAINSASLPSTK